MSNEISRIVFKKLKSFKDKPEEYLTAVKAAMNRLGLGNHTPTDQWFLERLNNPSMEFFVIQTVINEATGLAQREQYDASLQVLEGYFLPNHDQLSGIERFMNVVQKGLSLPFLTKDGTIIEIMKWSKSETMPIAQDFQLQRSEQRKVPIPLLYRVQIKVQVETTEKYGKQYKFPSLISVDQKNLLSLHEFQRVLLSQSKVVSELTKDDKYKLVVLRGLSWKTIQPLERWMKTGKQVKQVPKPGTAVKADAQGRPVYDFVDEIKRDPLGQELVQDKFGSEASPVPMTCFSLFAGTGDKNSVAINMWNNLYGKPLVWMASFGDIVKQAVNSFGNIKSTEETKCPFKHIDRLMNATELLVLGKIMNIYQPTPDGPIQFTLNGYMLATLQFPLFEAEDVPYPFNIKELVGAQPDLPIYNDVDINLHLGNIPADADVGFDMSIEEIGQKKPQFKGEQVPVEPKSDPSPDQYSTAPQEETFEHQKECQAWLDQLSDKITENDGFFKDSDFIQFMSEKEIMGKALIVTLQMSRNIWSPGDPTEHQAADPNGKLFIDSEVHEFFVKNILNKVPAVSEPKKSETAPVESKISEPFVPTAEENTFYENVFKPAFKEHFIEHADMDGKAPAKYFNKELLTVLVDLGGLAYVGTYKDHVLMPETSEATDPEKFLLALKSFVALKHRAGHKDLLWFLPEYKAEVEKPTQQQPTQPTTQATQTPAKSVKKWSDEYKSSTTDVVFTEEGLKAKLLRPLRKVAKDVGITGYSNMKKDEIIALILKTKSDSPTDSQMGTALPEPPKQPVLAASPSELAEEELPDDYDDDEGVLMQPIPEGSSVPPVHKPVVSTGLSENEQKDLDDLKSSINDYLSTGQVSGVTFQTLFHDWPGFLPDWVTEGHEPLITQIIEAVTKELS